VATGEYVRLQEVAHIADRQVDFFRQNLVRRTQVSQPIAFQPRIVVGICDLGAGTTIKFDAARLGFQVFTYFLANEKGLKIEGPVSIMHADPGVIVTCNEVLTRFTTGLNIGSSVCLDVELHAAAEFVKDVPSGDLSIASVHVAKM
jgi:hypothetical protein